MDVRGELLQLKETFNTMVEQLRGFASEVTRVAREVGTDGKLGGQAAVPGVVAGTWKDLTDSSQLDGLEFNGTGPKYRRRDDRRGQRRFCPGKLLQTPKGRNSRIEADHQHDGGEYQAPTASRQKSAALRVKWEPKEGSAARQSFRASRERGRTSPITSTRWRRTSPGRFENIAEVATAVARGDLSRKITVDVRGEILELKQTINTMVDRTSTRLRG